MTRLGLGNGAISDSGRVGPKLASLEIAYQNGPRVQIFMNNLSKIVSFLSTSLKLFSSPTCPWLYIIVLL